ncbi:hypothetical protein M011DRAFT_514985 [Sporormia fimetaria CBS 119925]|uniref:RING-type domain-containing protein n=1 Tax=Sporormia fimetaria CBS 119925 TaxID=1340428 RepID=A0A6A6VFZ7_9PLEO|nr:hypothetical protein M011DRAFT_514985 [Sporormia fimetaria CBS 119925]
MSKNMLPFESRDAFLDYLVNNIIDVLPGDKCNICYATYASGVPAASDASAAPAATQAQYADDSDVPVQLPCTHIFGRKCIKQWTDQAKAPTCPVCRVLLYPQDPNPTSLDWEPTWRNRVELGPTPVGDVYARRERLLDIIHEHLDWTQDRIGVYEQHFAARYGEFGARAEEFRQEVAWIKERERQYMAAVTERFERLTAITGEEVAITMRLQQEDSRLARLRLAGRSGSSIQGQQAMVDQVLAQHNYIVERGRNIRHEMWTTIVEGQNEADATFRHLRRLMGL